MWLFLSVSSGFFMQNPIEHYCPDGVLIGLLPESGRQKLSQDIRQDTTMTEVINFNRGVDA